MAVLKNGKTNDDYKSFIWKPRKSSCLNKDGTRDYEKLNALIKQAQAWIHEAIMLVFEQYSGTWQPMCSQSEEVMYRLAMDYEDFQQEAFCCFLNTLKELRENQPENLKKFFVTNFTNRIIDILKTIEKQVVGHTEIRHKGSNNKKQFSYAVCSLQETNEDGSLKYDLPDNTVKDDYFKDYYPRVSKLLTEEELQVCLIHFVEGYSIATTANKLKLSSRTVDNLISSIKNKLITINP